MSAFAVAMTRNKIAEGSVEKQSERRRIRAEFDAAAKNYRAYCAQLLQLHDAKADLLANIEQDKGNLRGFEAGWIANGIAGKNADERRANLEAIKRYDEEYQAVVGRIAANERQIKGEIDNKIIALEQDIRMTRYSMEFAITEGRMIAGESDERHAR